MTNIDELKKKLRKKKLKETKELIKAFNQIKGLTEGIGELVKVLEATEANYEQALSSIEDKRAKIVSEKDEFKQDFIQVLDELKELLPKAKAVQKVSLNNPSVIPKIDYKKLDSIVEKIIEEVVQKFVLEQNEVPDEGEIEFDDKHRMTKSVAVYEGFKITTTFERGARRLRWSTIKEEV